MTPSMEQYYKVKTRFEEFVVFFRLGDFYEMFDNDAKECSILLNLTLTKRGQSPMCGIPYESAEIYIKKLVSEHKKSVAICEQLETPEEARKMGRTLVKRDVTKKITPGTFIDLDSYENNFVLAIKENNDLFEMCWADLGTGDCFFDNCNKGAFLTKISNINPSEIIINKKINMNFEQWEEILQIVDFEGDLLELITFFFKNNGYLFHPNIVKFDRSIFMNLESSTLKNLEIFPLLFKFLDKTKTSMGKRILVNNLKYPICFQDLIEQKLDCVAFFMKYIKEKGTIHLPINDFIKISAKINTVKDLKKFCWNVLESLKIIKLIESQVPIYLLQKIESLESFTWIEKLYILLEESQFFEEVFITLEIQNLTHRYKAKMGEIFSLNSKYGINGKIKENNLIGFFIECNQKIVVPDFFIKKQETQSGFRYTTNEMILLEGEICSLRVAIEEANKSLLNKYLSDIEREKINIEKLCNLIGEIDYFQACATNSHYYNWVRPKFTKEQKLFIEEGEHPILQSRTRFIKNNTNLSTKNTIMLITGPNMGGKSTFLRQNALIALMAHCGMFVSCKSCEMSIFDNIFLRVGSEDSLIDNRSTFMTEMLECSNMLQKSTARSLMVLDEIGRGTNIKDGLSISSSIISWIHDHKNCLTIISTHYYELAEILSDLPAISFFKANYLIEKDKVKLLYEIVPGVSESSFGIFVCEMAGLPDQILHMSKKIFDEIQIKFILGK